MSLCQSIRFSNIGHQVLNSIPNLLLHPPGSLTFMVRLLPSLNCQTQETLKPISNFATTGPSRFLIISLIPRQGPSSQPQVSACVSWISTRMTLSRTTAPIPVGIWNSRELDHPPLLISPSSDEFLSERTWSKSALVEQLALRQPVALNVKWRITRLLRAMAMG